MNIYTLTQDAYLYIWFVLLCMLLDSEERVERLVVAWALVLILVLSTEGFLASVQGTQRGEFSFRNPNRASAYLTLSFFLLLHPIVPLPIKAILGVLVYAGVRATGSAAGSIGLTLAVFVFGWSLFYMRSAKVMRPLLLLGVVALGLAVLVINPTKNRDLASVLGSVAPTAADRIERSSETREEIWAKGMESFREHPLGIGPASFHKQIDSGISDDGLIELHSDPVATLVERGLVGFVGYIMLIVLVALEVFKMMHRSSEWKEVIWAAALAGACTVYFFYSITHEALHHETFWLMVALIFSQVRILEGKRTLGYNLRAGRVQAGVRRIRALPVASQ
jgi:O-antigen ligase